MEALYPLLLTVHILSAVFWAALIPADIVLRPLVFKDISGKGTSTSTISAWLKTLNLTGMIGMTGVLVTGILLVVLSPYEFFNFKDNHWLASKQILMVILLAVVGARIIPLGVKTRKVLEQQNDTAVFLGDALNNIRGLAQAATITGVLVLLNLLFAVTHRYMPS